MCCAGADLDFNKGGCLNERAVQWRMSRLQSSRGGWVREGGYPPPARTGAGAIRLFYGTRNTVRCNNYDYVTGLC